MAAVASTAPRSVQGFDATNARFFETAAKMQNSNDELKQELATEKQNEATLRSKVTLMDS